MTEPEPYVSAKTLAAALGVPLTRVREWVKVGRVPSYKFAGVRRFRLSEVEAALAAEAQEREERVAGTA